MWGGGGNQKLNISLTKVRQEFCSKLQKGHPTERWSVSCEINRRWARPGSMGRATANQDVQYLHNATKGCHLKFGPHDTIVNERTK
jgi:hypothetical protein